MWYIYIVTRFVAVLFFNVLVCFVVFKDVEGEIIYLVCLIWVLGFKKCLLVGICLVKMFFYNKGCFLLLCLEKGFFMEVFKDNDDIKVSLE